jgi:hypothetical protein
MQSSLCEFLAARARAAGGFTFRPSTSEFPTEGYAVAISKAYERTGPGDLTSFALAVYLAEHKVYLDCANVVHNGAACLGAWHYDGQWYLDISIVVPTLAQALQLGRENNQIAVYDLARGESITCTEVAA